jgi:acetyltransferase-like isoleucine patch superfamily enzyme
MFDPIPTLKGTLMRWLCPLFFQKIGKGTLFFGRTRLPMPFRRVTIGENCMIGEGILFHTGRDSLIQIGDDCSVNSGCHIVANERITVGANTAIAEYVTIRDQEHKFSPETGVRGQGYQVAPVLIGKNVWIGRGAYIGPGVTIGDGSIVGANSVVRPGIYPPAVLIAGVPAKIKKSILNTEIRS